MSETVFVLGAGASMPFGFPSGEGLINVIFKELKCTTKSNRQIVPLPEQKLLSILLENWDYHYIDCFLRSLKMSQTNSIDNFLSYNSQYRQIGKMCIYYIILNYERYSLSYEYLWKGDWCKYLWNIIDQQNFHCNFTIFTFNYDRSFEFYFLTTLRNLNDLKDKEAAKIFNRLKIRHFHGSLGEIDSDPDNYLPYGAIDTILNFSSLFELSKRIEVIYEVKGEKDLFQEFRNECSDAANIIFLGFGLNKENVDRLGLNKVEHKKIGEYFPVMVGGTCFQLTELEISMKTGGLNITALIDKKRYESTPNFKNLECLNFLRNSFDCSQLRKLNP